jgi:SNF2 family DNA or RNA helicase
MRLLTPCSYIKTPTTAMSEAACDLVADRKIALTGTPIQNKIDDIWALFKFLRLTPVNDKELFQKWIANPCRLGDTLGVARLRLVMQCCTLRRTKDSKADDGRAILNLPPRREIQHWLDLRDDERKVYDERRMAVQNKVHDLKATGELSKNYAHVLLELLRLRQICDHVELADSGAVEEDYDGTIMDYKVAMSGIEKYGLTQSRALSIVSFLKDGNGALCTACGHDYSDYYPSMDIGMEEVSGVKAEDGKGKKPRLKEKERPLLTRCLHLWCESSVSLIWTFAHMF